MESLRTNQDSSIDNLASTVEERLLAKFENAVSGPTSILSRLFPSLETRQLNKLKKETFQGQMELLKHYHSARIKEAILVHETRYKLLSSQAKKVELTDFKNFMVFIDETVHEMSHRIEEAYMKASVFSSEKAKSGYIRSAEAAHDILLESVYEAMKNLQNRINK